MYEHVKPVQWPHVLLPSPACASCLPTQDVGVDAEAPVMTPDMPRYKLLEGPNLWPSGIDKSVHRRGGPPPLNHAPRPLTLLHTLPLHPASNRTH